MGYFFLQTVLTVGFINMANISLFGSDSETGFIISKFIVTKFGLSLYVTFFKLNKT